MTQLQKGAKLYFIGIGGTGMASVAGLCQTAGYDVTGSDAGVYPPMSGMLEDLGIKVKTPYSPDNVKDVQTDLFVVANVLSKGHPELEAALATGKPYTSFPALLGDFFLSKSAACVVTGTHGKTTTTSLLSHVLHEMGEDPSFIIGGIPRNFPQSFRLGKSKLFCIEGDEYDTAFFDKGPKFLHYHPKHLILNNCEFDHADIYPNVEAIEAQFEKVTALVKDKSTVIANMDDPGIRKIIDKLGLAAKVTRVATLGEYQGAQVRLGTFEAKAVSAGEQVWTADIETDHLGTVRIETGLSGKHNLANIAMVVACLISLDKAGDLAKKLDKNQIIKGIKSFQNVKRRLDLLASVGGVDVYEDFAHHPTAVRLVIEGFREVFPKKRLIVAFEPRSASQRRNVFQKAFGQSLALADRVMIGECPVDKRIPEDQRMNTSDMASAIGSKAFAFPTNDALLDGLKKELVAGDAVIFMSSGSFSGAQHALAKDLRSRFG